MFGSFPASPLRSCFAPLLVALALGCGSSANAPDGTPFTAEQPGLSNGGQAGTAGSLEQPGTPQLQTPGDNAEAPGDLPLDVAGPGPLQPGEELEPEPGPPPFGASGGTRNLFTDLLGIPETEVADKVTTAVNRFFGIGTGEPNVPTPDGGFRVYYELPQDPSQAFIWAPDSDDIRSEGMSYGMMIAVQMNLQTQFDRLWKFAQTHMQYPADASGNVAPWRLYFKWQGSVDSSNPASWGVNYGEQTGPAPDGEEYFAAALYLADRRWGSDGAVNYRQHAEELSRAMLNNARSGFRTPVIHPDSNMVVFYPQGNSANFSDPSYHLPAFYELFALDGPEEDAARWQQLAEISRDFLVRSAHPVTGLHPDYANFDGTPNSGGSDHDDFRFDAWRVVMNMAVDHAWFSGDARMAAQVEKYHAFFATRLTENNVENQLFELDGSNPAGGGSSALTATLAAGVLASNAPNRAEYLDNLWNVPQQRGLYRYYQECVYLLGLLAASGYLNYEWPDTAP